MWPWPCGKVSQSAAQCSVYGYVVHPLFLSRLMFGITIAFFGASCQQEDSNHGGSQGKPLGFSHIFHWKTFQKVDILLLVAKLSIIFQLSLFILNNHANLHHLYCRRTTKRGRINKNLTLKNENNLFILFAQSIFCTIFAAVLSFIKKNPS